MFNVVIAEFRHETNTFSDKRTDLECYKRRSYVLGEAILPYFRAVRCELGGFINVLEPEPDIRLTPVLAANAMPAGPVTGEMFADTCARMTAALRAQDKVDAVLLSLHGAMVTEISQDGEGDFLEAIRQVVGEDTLIVATLDLHANLTEKMQKNADVLINCDEYPHSDMYERGLEAARCVLRTLRGEIRPVMRCARKPLLLASVPTALPAMKQYVDQVHEIEKDPRVLTVSISHGFFCADTAETGLTVVAVTDNDPELAQAIADKIASEIWESRRELRRPLYSAGEAIALAEKEPEGPVVLADVTDNPGGGSTCDGTHLLRAMIEKDVQDAAVALIYDPESVEAAERAGVGNTVHLRLGGKERPEILGGPIECEAYVKLLCDGKYKNAGPMGGGLPVDLRKSAVVVIGGIEVIVSCNITQPFDPQIFRAHGIEPAAKKILVVKSTIHFRAAFEPLAKRVIDVECPGLLPQDPRKLHYVRVKRPAYPLDEI